MTTSEGESARDAAIEALQVPGYALHWIPEHLQAAIEHATVVIERESRLSIAAALEPVKDFLEHTKDTRDVNGECTSDCHASWIGGCGKCLELYDAMLAAATNPFVARAERDRAVREKALEDLLKLIAIEHRWANWNICRCRKVADSPDRDRDLWQWWLVHIRALAFATEAASPEGQK